MEKVTLPKEKINWNTITGIFDSESDEAIVKTYSVSTLKSFFSYLTGLNDDLSPEEYVETISKDIALKLESTAVRVRLVDEGSTTLMIALDRKWTGRYLCRVPVYKWHPSIAELYKLYDVGSTTGRDGIEYISICIAEVIRGENASVYTKGFVFKIYRNNVVQCEIDDAWCHADDFNLEVYRVSKDTLGPRMCTKTFPILSTNLEFESVNESSECRIKCPICGYVSRTYGAKDICQSCGYNRPILLGEAIKP